MAKSISCVNFASRFMYSQTMPKMLNYGTRLLYTESAIGVDNYVKSREKVHVQFLNMSEKFKNKMQEFVEPKSTNMIFTEDLKNMVHLVEEEQKEIDLVIQMMKRFNQQNKGLRFGSFVFGPVVMRMFHFLNKPDEALQCFKDPELDGFFDQLMSYQILLDLLYNNKKYSEVIETYELIKSKQIQSSKYPKHVIVLTLAACYKQNTKESLEYALNLWKELQTVGHRPMRRAITFIAALAMNQGSPHIALEMISSVQQQSYMTIRNIRVAALAAVNRLEDVLPILRGVLEVDEAAYGKSTFNPEILDQVALAFEKTEDKELKSEFDRIFKALKQNDHISNKSLDQDICSEIQSGQNVRIQDLRPNYNYNKENRSNDFRPRRQQQQGGRNINRYPQRPGLSDMY